VLVQGGKLQQVELLALANSRGTWADQHEVSKLNDSLHAMRSQVGAGTQDLGCSGLTGGWSSGRMPLNLRHPALYT
jgi:hypothetical protein